MAIKTYLKFLQLVVTSSLIFCFALWKTQPSTQQRISKVSRSLIRSDIPSVDNITITHNTSLTGQDLKDQLDLLDDLLLSLTSVTRPCKRLSKQGGKICKRRLDGDKKICLDPAVRPEPSSCLVYSFGIGYDFSFDAAMGRYGCKVFSFDDDSAHESLRRNPYPNVTFLRVRLASVSTVSIELAHHLDHHQYLYVYRPLDNIKYLLGHNGANIDVLKIDVDGPEWEIFVESIFKTDILEWTKQLSVEVHLSVFLDPKLNTSRPLTQALKQYMRFFRGLEERGMRLAHNDPNLFYPKVAKYAGRTFHIFYELLWININFKKARKRYFRKLNDKDFDEIEMKG